MSQQPDRPIDSRETIVSWVREPDLRAPWTYEKFTNFLHRYVSAGRDEKRAVSRVLKSLQPQVALMFDSRSIVRRN